MPITTRKSVNRKINMTENTTASGATDLPEFPGHPESHNMMWAALEIVAIKKYGEDMFRAGRLAASAPVAPAPQRVAPGEPPGIQALMCVISSLHSLRDWAYAQTAAFQPSPNPAPATQQAGEMEVFGLQWPGEDRINLSTVFDTEAEALEYMQNRCDTPGIRIVRLSSNTSTAQAAESVPAPLSEMPYEKRKAIQEGAQISASDAWFIARHEMLDTIDRRNVFRAGFDRGWNAALAAQGGKDA